MTYIYPKSDLDRPEILSGLLGSFWSGTYEGSHDVESFLSSRARLEAQASQNLQEAINATSRLEIDPLHTEIWHPLILKESEMNQDDFSVPKYGEGFVYGAQPETDITLLYGDPLLRDVYAFPLPDGLKEVPLAANRTDAPTVSWQYGLDLIIEDGWLKFRKNPFDNENISVRQIIEDDTVVDREVVLWLFRSKWDKDYIWIHFGHILGYRLDSSEPYKRLVNAVFDAIVEGNSIDAVDNLVAAITDTPLALEEETVEKILTTSKAVVVITDKNAYRHSPDSTPAVSVGDELHKGQFICKAGELFSPAHDTKPEWLAAVSLDEALTDQVYRGGLLFIDEDLPVTITTEDSRTRVELDVRGFPRTVSKFWDEVHARGVQDGTTLANLLDLRPSPIDDPTAASLPTTENPLDFLLENILRNNALIVTIRPPEFGTNQLPFTAFSLLRRILPPQKTVILIVQLESNENSVPQTGEEEIEPTIWLVEFSEDGILSAENEELLPGGYTDGVCW